MEEDKGSSSSFFATARAPARHRKQRKMLGRWTAVATVAKKEVGSGGGREGEKKLFFQALIPPKRGGRAEGGTILFSHG